MVKLAVFKMCRKIVLFCILFGIAFTSWSYWKRKAEFKETIFILKKKFLALKDTLRPHSVNNVSLRQHIAKNISIPWQSGKNVSLQKHTNTTSTIKGIPLAGYPIRDTSLQVYGIEDITLQLFPATCASNLSLIIIVTSYVGHIKLRNVHRKAIPEGVLRENNATRVFLLGRIPENETKIDQSAIFNESKTFGDILQGTFIENFRNLTYKHLMGLKWASTICQGASFILKVDDDTVYILENTFAILKSVANSTALLMGYVNNVTMPDRNKESKWYVSWYEYPRRKYPAFLPGFYYITTPQVAAALCDEALYYPFFWIDDIFVTGLLPEALGMKLTTLPSDTFWRDNFMNCDYNGDLEGSQFSCDVFLA